MPEFKVGDVVRIIYKEEIYPDVEMYGRKAIIIEFESSVDTIFSWITVLLENGDEDLFVIYKHEVGEWFEKVL
jgi:hypothetical protein